jgi:hypothetical protein
MTHIEKTIQTLATLASGTVLTKREYTMLSHTTRKEDLKNGKEGIRFTDWQNVLDNPERYGVERIEIAHKVPTTKVTTVDVLEMVKNGCSVEEIENAIYTTTTEIRIKIK